MSTRISVDVSDLFPLAADLANAHEVIAGGAARAVNAVAKYARKETVSRITSMVNLRESYVDGALRIDQDATPDSLTASISAPIAGVFVDRYRGGQLSRANVWTEAMYAAKFGSLATQRRPKAGAPLMPWTPRTGDQSLNRRIAPGQKAAGIGVSVLAGSGVKRISYAFFLPLRQGRVLGDSVGAFKRPKGGGKVKAVKSLSVDQMSKIVWRKAESEFSERLGTTVADEVMASIEKELKI